LSSALDRFSGAGERPVPRGLVLAAVGVFGYLVARACIQSVTIDEADSFLQYATGPTWAAWYPAAANHLLNTLLERFSWTLFGFNQVAMRLPALLGAAIYLFSAVTICAKLSGKVFRSLVFACLVFNPFILDYLVAARGYSLAVACLLATIALFWGVIDRGLRAEAVPLYFYALGSILLALSFAANFSFGVANVVTGAVLLLAAAMSERLGQRHKALPAFPRRRAALLVICGTLPGLAVALFLCSSMLMEWRGSLLVYGSNSLHAMWKSVFGASFPPPNPEIVNGLLYPVWAWIGIHLHTLVIPLFWIQLATLVGMPRLRGLLLSRSSGLIATALTVIAALTVVLHWLAFRTIGMPLPEARTGLFFVPFLTLAFAAGADVLRRDSDFRAWSIPGMAVLTICAAYFLTCLRLHYFQEWRFNEDTNEVFREMRTIEQRCGIHEFVTQWHYEPVLNYYRRQYEAYTLNPFSPAFKEAFPQGKNSYVLFYPEGESLIKNEGLGVWYHNDITGAVVAVRGCGLGPATP
jgi:hypothetical protein